MNSFASWSFHEQRAGNVYGTVRGIRVVTTSTAPHIAKQRNLQPLLLEVVRQMMQNLETSPREWGDPYRNFRALQTVRYGKTIMAAGLRITHVVHDTEPIVWITSIRPLFGSPFT